MSCVWHQVISHQHLLSLSKWLRYQMYQILMPDVILIDTTHQRLPQGHLCMVAAMVCILMNSVLQFVVHYIFKKHHLLYNLCVIIFAFIFLAAPKLWGFFKFFFLDAADVILVFLFFFCSYLFITKGELINWSVCKASANI